MATETDFLRQAIIALGGSCDDLADNLESTLYKKLIELCASGGGGGSSLPTGGSPNQMLVTDSTGTAGWEDRICYAESGMMDIFPESAWTITDGEAVAMVAPAADIVTGQKYIVTINGEELEREAVEISMNGMTVQALGNAGALDETAPTTDDMFVIIVVPGSMDGMYAAAQYVDGTQITSLSIRGEAEIVKKIDKKYIPGYTFGDFPFSDRVFLPETTYDMAESYVWIYRTEYPLVAGYECTVNYNGVEYNLQARDYNGNVALGRVDGATDEPFGVLYWPEGGYTDEMGTYYVTLYVWDGATSATVSITGKGTEIVKVPGRLIEDTAVPLIVSVVRGSYLNTTINSVSHTYDEIKQAYAAGRAIFCWLVTGDGNTRDYLLPLIEYSSIGAFFVFQTSLWGDFENYKITITESTNTLEEMAGPTFNTVEITRTGSGLVMTSPSGTRYQLAVADDGTLTTTAL